jgi:ATP-dependent DNA ligase
MLVFALATFSGITPTRAFDLLAMDGDDLRDLPLSMRKANLARLLARRPDGIFVSDFEHGEIGPDLFRKACELGLEGLVHRFQNPNHIRRLDRVCRTMCGRPDPD